GSTWYSIREFGLQMPSRASVLRSSVAINSLDTMQESPRRIGCSDAKILRRSSLVQYSHKFACPRHTALFFVRQLPGVRDYRLGGQSYLPLHHPRLRAS